MAGPIRPGRFEREGKLLRIEEAQAPGGQGRSGHVAAKAFEPTSVRACDPRSVIGLVVLRPPPAPTLTEAEHGGMDPDIGCRCRADGRYGGNLAEYTHEMRGTRTEMGELRQEMGELRKEMGELRERVARVEGLLEGLREAILSRAQPPSTT